MSNDHDYAGQMTAFKRVISMIETPRGGPDGGYDEEGSLITNRSSRYFGEKAYGKYQIMPGNWPAWSSAAGIPGASIKDPVAQERVASYVFSRYLKKYGRWDLVAVAWFGGEGAANKVASGSTDILSVTDSTATYAGTSIGKYMRLAREGMAQYGFDATKAPSRVSGQFINPEASMAEAGIMTPAPAPRPTTLRDAARVAGDALVGIFKTTSGFQEFEQNNTLNDPTADAKLGMKGPSPKKEMLKLTPDIDELGGR